MTLKEAVAYGEQFLSYNGVEEADFKALCLACHCARVKTSHFKQKKDFPVSMKKFADLLWRVKSGEPLQYVLGEWDFYDSTFKVGKGVLIPRPETEELVEKCLQIINTLDTPIIYDLCSGSGCIAVSIAKKVKKSFVYAVEKYDDAFQYLLENSNDCANVKVVKGDVLNPKFELPKADLIVSNPPYIKTDEIESLQQEVQQEPNSALDGGKDGLVFYRALCDIWSSCLKSGGYIAVEIGNEQADDVKEIFSKKFENVCVFKDCYNNDRIVTAKKLD